MKIFESATIDASDIRVTKDGYLVAQPRVARTGVQNYKGVEVGTPSVAKVRVNRPEKVVFSKDSLSSYANKPLTFGHPSVFVDSRNWREHAVGHTGGEVVRDGDFVRVPIMVTDEDVISAIKSGQVKELSLGYEMELEYVKGNDSFDAEVKSIQANHLAIVPSARGGPDLTIGDNQRSSQMTNGAISTTAVDVDGVSIQVQDVGAGLLANHLKAQRKVLDEAVAKVAELEKKIKSKDDELKENKEKAKESAATNSTEFLNKAVRDRIRTDAIARVLLGQDARLDAMDTLDIKRACLVGKIPSVKDWDEKSVDAAFDAACAFINVKPAQAAQPLQHAPQPGAFSSLQQPIGDHMRTFPGDGMPWRPGAQVPLQMQGPVDAMDAALARHDAFLTNAYRGADAVKEAQEIRLKQLSTMIGG